MPWFLAVRSVLDSMKRQLSTDVGLWTWNIQVEPVNEETGPTVGGSNLREQEVTKGLPSSGEDVNEEQMKELDNALTPTSLSEEGFRKMRQLFLKYKTRWTRQGYGTARSVFHDIILKDRNPVVMPPRAIPLKWQPIIDEEIAKMLKDGVIEPSSSPYCANPVMVGKKVGGLRFVIDYRRLNEVTVIDKTPLPRIADMFAATSGSRYFATLVGRGIGKSL